jgi:hypothetical protein
MEESVMSDYGDELNEARQRKKQLRPVFLNEQETAQENKKRVPAVSPNTNIGELEKILESHANYYNESVFVDNLSTEEAKTQLEALITAAKIEELKKIPNHTSINLYVRERIKELEQQ